MGIHVPSWEDVKKSQPSVSAHDVLSKLKTSPVKRKEEPIEGTNESYEGRGKKRRSGRNGEKTFTSKYRGVHQTFPTKRWEAQFRKFGKPTSLGCFDEENQAARAYDKMMLWCEIHQVGSKSGQTNFPPESYKESIDWLQKISQDDLVEELRSEGRRQAVERNQKHKNLEVSDKGRRTSSQKKK